MAKRNPSSNPASDDDVLQRLRGHLTFLGLTHTLHELDELLAWARRERPAMTVLLEHILGAEAGDKRQKRIERRISTSGLTERKTLEAFDWAFQPSLDKSLVMELARLDFVGRHENLVITGKAGTGKSHILKALTVRACERGIPTRYARCVDLLDDLHAGLADGTYPRRLKAWARAELLVLDDVGLGQIKSRGDEPTAAHTLYNLIDRRHGKVSTAFTSNIALSEWGKYLGDVTLTAAILDRVAEHAVRIDIDGPSYRQHLGQVRAEARAAKKN